VAKPKPAPEKPAVILAEKKVENAPPAPKEKPPEKKSIYIVEGIKAGKISEVKFEREDGSR
jgi:hypothetical protein